MKRLLILVLLISIACTGMLAAQENDNGGLEPLMAPGDFAVSAGLGYGFFWGAIDVSGGVELMLSRYDLGGELPLTFGVAGKVNYFRYNYSGYRSDYHYTYLGGGGFGTVHLGLKELNLDENMQWLANIDTYVGIGVGFYSYSNSWDDELGDDYSTFQIGLRSTAGVNYFLTPNVAINFEGGYYGGWGGGGLIGVLVKL
ncbi:MAG: hypothetical protein ACOCXF_00305 [bacterium]